MRVKGPRAGAGSRRSGGSGCVHPSGGKIARETACRPRDRLDKYAHATVADD